MINYCPRCGGNVFHEPLYDEVVCLQCGYTEEFKIPKILPHFESTEEIKKFQHDETENRNELIHQLALQGWTIKEIKRKFHLGTEYIKRIIREKEEINA